VKKYGPYLSDSPTMKAITKIFILYTGLGNQVEDGLIDSKLAYSVFRTACCRAWEKMKPIIEGYARTTNQSGYGSSFEYLYNEFKKKDQAGVKNG
jgi:hypothetical protein